MVRVRLGRQFRLLWSAYVVSAYGTGMSFGAFTFVGITVLHAGSSDIAALSAASTAGGALLALPLGPWVEFRRKRPVMVSMDLIRVLGLMSVPIAYLGGVLSVGQLVAVSIVIAAAKIAFSSASGAYLSTIVTREHVVVAASRFESTNWSATAVGPVLGGAAMSVLGPVASIVADATSYCLSAMCIGAIGTAEIEPPIREHRPVLSQVVDGWREIFGHSRLRWVFINGIAVNALIMAAEPPLSVLMLTTLQFPPWQYALAFAVPCVGGLVGSRLAQRLVFRWGRRTVLVRIGALRVVAPLGLAFVTPGLTGLMTIIGVEGVLIFLVSLHNPVVSAFRIDSTDSQRLARLLSAWSVSSGICIAATTLAWGVLADATSPRLAIAASGALLLLTPAALYPLWRSGRRITEPAV